LFLDAVKTHIWIDKSFQPFVDPQIKGSAVDLGVINLVNSLFSLSTKIRMMLTMIIAQETQAKLQEQFMTAKEEHEKTGGACGMANQEERAGCLAQDGKQK
jgi:hypothetical protein